MKAVLTTLFTFTVIVSSYQYHPALMMGPPWLSPFENEVIFKNPPSYQLPYPGQLYNEVEGFNTEGSTIHEDAIPRLKAYLLPASDVSGRVNKLGVNEWYPRLPDKKPLAKKPLITKKPTPVTKPPKQQQAALPTEEEQSERFLYQLAYNLLLNKTAKSSTLMKTVTFTLTSTCTALTFTTCIPSSGLVSPIVVCNAGRKKRNAQKARIEAFSPTVTLPVVPTEQPMLTSSEDLPDSKSAPVIVSSKEDASVELNQYEVDDPRQKRFVGALGYSLWQAFATGTTVTSWSVTSTTITQTINPPAGTPFPCLPSGITTCAAAVTIGK